MEKAEIDRPRQWGQQDGNSRPSLSMELKAGGRETPAGSGRISGLPPGRAGTVMRQAAALAGFVALCFLVAFLGANITTGSTGGWYAEIQKPAWTPPDWVFPPVWTTLYAMIAMAGWLVWREGGGSMRSTALRIWLIQLALNCAWTPLFFGLREPGAAAVDIVLLWLAVGAFVPLAARVSKPAAILFVPYWAWVTFAAALNVTIWVMNPVRALV